MKHQWSKQSYSHSMHSKIHFFSRLKPHRFHRHPNRSSGLLSASLWDQWTSLQFHPPGVGPMWWTPQFQPADQYLKKRFKAADRQASIDSNLAVGELDVIWTSGTPYLFALILSNISESWKYFHLFSLFLPVGGVLRWPVSCLQSRPKAMQCFAGQSAGRSPKLSP